MNQIDTIPTFRFRKAVLGLSIAALATLPVQYILSAIPITNDSAGVVMQVDLLYTLLFSLIPSVLLVLYSASFFRDSKGRFVLFTLFGLLALRGAYSILTAVLSHSLIAISLLPDLAFVTLFALTAIPAVRSKKPHKVVLILLTVAVVFYFFPSVINLIRSVQWFGALEYPRFFISGILSMVFAVLFYAAVLLCAYNYPTASIPEAPPSAPSSDAKPNTDE